MRKLLCVLIAILILTSIVVVPVSAESQDTLSYILDNVDILGDLYTYLHPDAVENFEGTSVELILPVEVVSTGSVGTYIDFDGNNGYLILVDGNDVIKWEVLGDLDYLKDEEQVYYSLLDGFGYFEEEAFVPFELDTTACDGIIQGDAYSGQTRSGEGSIYDLDQYIIDRYDSHYKNTLAWFMYHTFDYVEQSDYSIYSHKVDGEWVSEGNCGLAAAYAMLNFLQKSGKCPKLPAASEQVSYAPINDSFYSKYDNNSDYRITPTIVLPTLYYRIRVQAINKYGYEVGGFYSGYNAALINSIFEVTSTNATASLHTLGSLETCVVNQLKAGKPVLFSVDLSQTYGSHSLVITGYKQYCKTTTVLGIDFKDYVHILRVNDNWTAEARYFDFTAFSGTWSFTTVEIG